MIYNKLGKTGLEVSLLGFGGIPIQRVSTDEAVGIIDKALEKGINFIDTARAYNDSERKIGQALQGKRDKVVLATKSMARSYEKMKQEIQTSLQELKTDYIDLYQCHNVKTREELSAVLAPQGALKALQEAKEAGKIRHIGITGHRPTILVEALKTECFATVQVPYNYVEQQAAEELLPLARKNNIGIIVMKPLAGGAYIRADLALKYLLRQDVTTVIPGMDSLEQVEMNAGLAEENRELTALELEILDQEAQKLGQEFCRRCEYCKPCPKGIDIPSCFIFHGYFLRYGLPEWAQERYRSMKIKADACVECGLCESRCPYGLPIRKMLKKVHADLG